MRSAATPFFWMRRRRTRRGVIETEFVVSRNLGWVVAIVVLGGFWWFSQGHLPPVKLVMAVLKQLVTDCC